MSSRYEILVQALDAVISPGTRQTIFRYLQDLTSERPFLASYIALVALFSVPAVLGLTSAIILIVFSIVFWLGVALSFFIGVIMITTLTASAFWVYGTSVFLVAQYVLQLFRPSDVRPAAAITAKSGTSTPAAAKSGTATPAPASQSRKSSSATKSPRSPTTANSSTQKIQLPSMEATTPPPESEPKTPVKTPRRKSSSSKAASAWTSAIDTDGANDEKEDEKRSPSPDIEDAVEVSEDGTVKAKSVYKPKMTTDAEETEREKMMRDIARSLK